LIGLSAFQLNLNWPIKEIFFEEHKERAFPTHGGPVWLFFVRVEKHFHLWVT
jgi:hypothetical protein